jgi:hypothetical protein
MDEKLSKIRTDIENIDTRLGAQEKLAATMNEMGKSINTLAINMQYMVEEQIKQGKRLDALEEKPKKRMDTVITAVISTLVGTIMGLLITWLTTK